MSLVVTFSGKLEAGRYGAFLHAGAPGFAGWGRHEHGFSGGLHHPPKAKRVIQLFMAGAASHVDLFDHKPQLERLDNHGIRVKVWSSFRVAQGTCLLPHGPGKPMVNAVNDCQNRLFGPLCG